MPVRLLLIILNCPRFVESRLDGSYVWEAAVQCSCWPRPHVPSQTPALPRFPPPSRTLQVAESLLGLIEQALLEGPEQSEVALLALLAACRAAGAWQLARLVLEGAGRSGAPPGLGPLNEAIAACAVRGEAAEVCGAGVAGLVAAAPPAALHPYALALLAAR